MARTVSSLHLFAMVFFLIVKISGESAVGKSSLVLRFVKGQFHEYQESTIGGEIFWFKWFLLVYLFSLLLTASEYSHSSKTAFLSPCIVTSKVVTWVSQFVLLYIYDTLTDKRIDLTLVKNNLKRLVKAFLLIGVLINSTVIINNVDWQLV